MSDYIKPIVLFDEEENQNSKYAFLVPLSGQTGNYLHACEGPSNEGKGERIPNFFHFNDTSCLED